jgi:DNA-binding NtrC family response regulator
LTDQTDPEEKSSDQEIDHISIEPAWWAASETPNDAEIENWTWEQFRHGLSHAGVTAWEWDIKTGEVLIYSAPEGHPFCYDFSSPTTWGKIVHKEHRERFREALRIFQQTSWSWFDCFFRLATRVPRWVHARNIHLLLDSDGNPAKVRGLFFDATESQLAKNQLFWDRKPSRSDNKSTGLHVQRLSELARHSKDAKKIKLLRTQCDQEFKCLFDYSNLPAFKRNSNLVTIRINRAMSLLLGIPPLEIRKYTDRELWGDEGSAHLHQLCGYVLQGESIVATNDRYINGAKISFIDHLFPCWNSKGYVDGVHGVMAPLPTWIGSLADTPSDNDMLAPKGDPQQRHFQEDSVISLPSAMEAVLAQVQLAAQYDCNVLLTGESGTGKDYLARKIHGLSKRSEGPFENFNCAALQKELAGSGLFGHEAGAFTGAKAMRRGIFELANEGTVFLNEIGDMPLDLQPTLLTILESRSFRRVGGEKTLRLGARIIAATNVDLNRGVEDGNFRKDLYHRLTVFTIRVPPLRERIDELPALIENLMQKLVTDMGLETVPKLHQLAMRKLSEYAWPGNIRELGNVLERATIHAQGLLIGPNHIIFEAESTEGHAEWTTENEARAGKSMSPEKQPRDLGSGKQSRPANRLKKPTHQSLRKLYEDYIVGHGWSREQLAKHLGTDSSTVKKWFKEAGLPAGKAGRPKKKPDA